MDVREVANLISFENQKEVYDVQLRMGELTPEGHEQLVIDAQRLLLRDTISSEHKEKFSTGNWLLPIMLIFLMLTCIGFYQIIGSAEDEKIFEQLSIISAHSQTPAVNDSLGEDLAQKIQNRVIDRPRNIHYWILLAKFALERSDLRSATEYLARAVELDPRNVDLLAKYTQTLFLADGGIITERVGIAMDKVFALDPENEIVLGLKGIEAYSEGKLQSAINFWENALSRIDISDSMFQALESGISRARIEILERDTEATGVDTENASSIVK